MYNMQYLNMYQNRINSTTPGCFIVLIDQSGSMLDPFGQGQAAAGQRKCDQVATVVNRLISELVKSSTVSEASGAIVKDRLHIAVLGYHDGAVYDAIPRVQGLTPISQVAANPLRVENRMAKEWDAEMGQWVEIPSPFQVWVEAKAEGGTPMSVALNRARDLAANWAANFQQCYPPIVVNVTDGQATDGDPRPAAAPLCSITTSDGAALLFNCHITETNQPEVRFPADQVELQHLTNQFALPLFEMSSVIPETMRAVAIQRQIVTTLAPYARGFVFNGQIDSVAQMLTIASVGSGMK